AVAGEGLIALGLEGGLPGAEESFADVEGAGGLRDGVALLGDELDRLDLELAGVAPSLPGHGGPPEGKFTPLTWCPPFLGRFKVLLAFLKAEAMDKPTLGLLTGYAEDYAASVLRGLCKSCGGIFAPAITLPGRKNAGGYHVRIRRNENKKST